MDKLFFCNKLWVRLVILLILGEGEAEGSGGERREADRVRAMPTTRLWHGAGGAAEEVAVSG